MVIKSKTNVSMGDPVDIVLVDKALESFRDSGFDLPTAVGECVDNSWEARATTIRINALRNNKGDVIEALVFGDNGIGIEPNILASVLQLGYSTRYNQRTGLGRYGVGVKLAALSQARRLEFYTKPKGHQQIYHSFVDLDMVSNNEQQFIEAKVVEAVPDQYLSSILDKSGNQFDSWTIVVWSKVDRLVHGGRYGQSLNQKESELMQFLARAYRKFISNGFVIELNGKVVELCDPLFSLESPFVTNIFGEDKWTADKSETTTIDIDGTEILITVSLYPEIVRRVEGEGGWKGSAKRFAPLKIPDNQGCISILRNGREIYYDQIPRILPNGIEKVDRFIGIEVSFPGTLDEYFQVRNVKRGAQPVDKLYTKIQKALIKPVTEYRKEIRVPWEKTDKKNKRKEEEHLVSTKAVTRAEETNPKGRGDSGESIKGILDLLIEDLDIDIAQEPKRVEELKAKVETQAITMIDSSWPGSNFLELTHYNGSSIIRINERHIFIAKVYRAIKNLANQEPSTIDVTETRRVARLVQNAIDVLIMAYAKAENMHPDPDRVYSDLRNYWGQFTAAYVRELLSEDFDF